ncbi:MAG: hypothetical protein WCI55_00285 [Armatimonadota bacterium]
MLTHCLALVLLAKTPEIQREKRMIEGWTVQINTKLFEQDKQGTEKALSLLKDQFIKIKRLVPNEAVTKLQLITLWFSPEYPGVRGTAEYHPGANWLKENGRDPIMAKGIEFTGVSNFEAELKRMPVLVLHELAHGYHDQVLGFNNPQVATAYKHAKASGKYDSVQRWLGTKFAAKPERAYAMTSPQEYFAEGTEAYFDRNDFFPFNREELKATDQELFLLLDVVWNKP